MQRSKRVIGEKNNACASILTKCVLVDFKKSSLDHSKNIIYALNKWLDLYLNFFLKK